MMVLPPHVIPVCGNLFVVQFGVFQKKCAVNTAHFFIVPGRIVDLV